jgi:hypothetical protein
LPANPVRLTIGLIIAFSVMLLYRGARLPPHPSWLLTGGVSVCSGIISGLASMGGPPLSSISWRWAIRRTGFAPRRWSTSC